MKLSTGQLPIIPVFFSLALGSYLCTAISEPEFYWHLTLGRWISANWTVPDKNIWSVVGLGTNWLSDSWLFDFLVVCQENFFGDKALIFFKIIIFFLAVLGFHILFSSCSGDRFIGGGIAVLVACGALDRAALSPQLLGLALYAGLLYFLYRFNDGLWVRSCFFLLAMVSSNSQVSFAVISVCLLLLFFFSSPRISKSGGLYLILALALSIFCSPYLGSQFLSSLLKLFAEIDYVLRFRPSPANVFDYGFSFLLILWLMVVVLSVRVNVRSLWPELLLAALTSIVSLAERNTISYALLFCGLLLSRIWSLHADTVNVEIVQSLLKLKAKLSALPAVGVAWILLCVVIVNVANLLQFPFDTRELPQRAVDYILDQRLPFPLFHESAIAPYLAYRFADSAGVPKNLIAIDNRARLLAPELARNEMTLSKLSYGWEKYFSYFKAKTVLVKTFSPLYEVLKREKGWKMVFSGYQPVGQGAEYQEPLPYTWTVFAVLK